MKSNKQKRLKKVAVYDEQDTPNFIVRSKRIKLSELGLKLPATPPTQVVSIRLPSELLNEIKAIGSQRDIPYQALIKLFLSESVAGMKKR